MRVSGGDAGLYLVDIDGGRERSIYAAQQLRTPAWSPDGAHIVFSRIVGQDRCRDVGHGVCLPDAPWLAQFPLKIIDVRGLSLVNRDGGDFRDLPSEKQAISPDWGDGGILYHAANGLQIIENPLEDGASTRPFLEEFKYSDPAWSPDGRAVVFVSLEKDHREVFRAGADGSGVMALTRPHDFIEDPRPVQRVAPTWSPDGRYVLYLADDSGEWMFYVMKADGSDVRPLPLDIPIDYRFQQEQVADWGR